MDKKELEEYSEMKKEKNITYIELPEDRRYYSRNDTHKRHIVEMNKGKEFKKK